MSDLTQILERVERGDGEAAEELLPLVYEELRELAAYRWLRRLLSAHDPVKARLVELRFFTGLSLEEAAQVLGVSTPTAKRYWAYARAWLFQEIERLR